MNMKASEHIAYANDPRAKGNGPFPSQQTGSHPGAAVTRALADAALANGAAFVKTSTGKAGPGASPEAARILCEAVRDAGTGGVKVSGGVRTAEQADHYVQIAEEILGAGWATPDHFRIGASSLLDELLARA